MGLFDDMKLRKNKAGNYTVTYCKKPFITVYSNGFVQLFKDYASKTFINELVHLGSNTTQDEDLAKKVDTLNNIYSKYRRQFYDNKNLTKISVGSAAYKDLMKACKTIAIHKSTAEEYMLAQIEGLAFSKSYPKTSQLHGMNAEDRLLKYRKDESASKDLKTFDRIKLTWDDKKTPLQDNMKYQDFHQKILDGTANVQEAYYVYDVEWERKKGKESKTVVAYLDRLEKESKE